MLLATIVVIFVLLIAIVSIVIVRLPKYGSKHEAAGTAPWKLQSSLPRASNGEKTHRYTASGTKVDPLSIYM